MEGKYCQSCGMPIGKNDEVYGTEENGSKSNDYCKYCYTQGKFTTDVTMEEMIEICVPHMTNANSQISEEQARNMMKEFFPTLKRWQQN